MNDQRTFAPFRAETVPGETRKVRYPERVHTYVYFITDGEHVKIGYSASPSSRIGVLQTSTARKLKMLAHFPGTEEDEQRLHQHFRQYRLEGEWFTLSYDILTYIERLKSGASYEEAKYPAKPKPEIALPAHPLAALTPARALRGWLVRMASNDPLEGEMARKAEAVRLAIGEYKLNFGTAAKELSRKNLNKTLHAFEAA